MAPDFDCVSWLTGHGKDAKCRLLDGVAWVVVGITWFLAPDYSDALFRYLQPVFLAELAAMLWLLIVGAKEPPHVAAAIT